MQRLADLIQLLPLLITEQGAIILKAKNGGIKRKNAIEKAEEMRQKKITSLKKQIEKLEEMRFE